MEKYWLSHFVPPNMLEVRMQATSDSPENGLKFFPENEMF